MDQRKDKYFPEEGEHETEQDPMAATLQKSIIANIVSGARATLHEPTRPETPGDLPRHLFSGNDYSERPSSAYKMGSVTDSAAEEFTTFASTIQSQHQR